MSALSTRCQSSGNRPDPDILPGERRLIRAAKHGDRAALEVIYVHYHPRVVRLSHSILRDAVASEDAAQETFARFLTHMGNFDVDRPIWPWLSTIARNVALDAHRSKGRVEPIDDTLEPRISRRELPDPTAEAALDRMGAQMLRTQLSAAFAILSSRERSILWLREEEDLPYQKIAHANGTTVDAVRNVAWRARERLRAALETRPSLGLFLLPAWIRGWGRRSYQRIAPGWDRIRSWLALQPLFEHLLVVTMVAGLTTSASDRVGIQGEAMRADTVSAATGLPLRTAEASAAGHRPEDQVSVESDPLVLALDVTGREDAAAPNRTKLRWEIHGLDGPLLAKETSVECSQASTSVLPQSGPVRAYC